jgi:FkbM family methyltransferase
MLRIPQNAVVEQIGGGVCFEHANLPFLADEDMRAMRTQSYDLSLCDWMRKGLSKGEVVIDVGANVGYISAVAASCVGTTGEVHGFEPLPECFERLETLRRLNPVFKFHFNNVAVGAEDGSLAIAYNPNGEARNASLVPHKTRDLRVQTKQVPVRRLDEYIAQSIASPEKIRLIKIDVEGFEFSVLRGMERFFSNTSFRPPIICEVKPWEIRNIGFAMTDFEEYISRHRYQTYRLGSEGTPISLAGIPDMETVVFRAK